MLLVGPGELLIEDDGVATTKTANVSSPIDDVKAYRVSSRKGKGGKCHLQFTVRGSHLVTLSWLLSVHIEPSVVPLEH